MSVTDYTPVKTLGSLDTHSLMAVFIVDALISDPLWAGQLLAYPEVYDYPPSSVSLSVSSVILAYPEVYDYPPGGLIRFLSYMQYLCAIQHIVPTFPARYFGFPRPYIRPIYV